MELKPLQHPLGTAHLAMIIRREKHLTVKLTNPGFSKLRKNRKHCHKNPASVDFKA